MKLSLIANYNLCHIDHSDGYGGVLIRVRAELISEILLTNSSCEIRAVKIHAYHNQELIIIGTYRPPNRDVLYQQELCNCICEIVRKHPSAFILCAGDLNLPDINWSNESITGYRYPLAINSSTLRMSADCCFTQLIFLLVNQIL